MFGAQGLDLRGDRGGHKEKKKPKKDKGNKSVPQRESIAVPQVPVQQRGGQKPGGESGSSEK